MRGDLDRDQRQLVLIPKQRVGTLCDRQPAFDLGAAGQEKDGADAHPVNERQRVMRHQPGQLTGQAVPEAAHAG